MKTRKMIALFMLASIGFVSCKKETASEVVTEPTTVETTSTTTTDSPEIAMANKAITFDVEGMTCAVGCAAKIEKELKEMPGVASATVNFDTKKATVDFDENVLKSDQIVAKVESIAKGAYKVNNVQDAISTPAEVANNKKACCSPDKKKDCGKDKKGVVKECCKSKEGKEKECCKNKNKSI